MQDLLGRLNVHRILALMEVLAFLSVFCLGMPIVPLDSKLPAPAEAVQMEPSQEFNPVTTMPVDIPFNNNDISMTNQSVLQVDPSGHHLLDENGDPVLLVGDAGWSAIAQLSTSEMDTYLEDRASRGFNAVLVNLIEHHFADNPPNNYYDDPPFTGAVFTTPNEAYFTIADHFISKASSLGIYVLLAPVYLGFEGTEEGWDSEIAAASVSDMQAWGEYVGNRYKNYNNIIWVIGGDQNVANYMIKLNAFVTGLQNYDTRHTVMTVHNGPGNLGSYETGNPSWLTLESIYVHNADVTTEAQTAYAETPTRPFIHIEGTYESGGDEVVMRSQMYWTILGGGVGHVFGNANLWFFPSGWQNQLDTPGAAGMTHLGSLFNSIPWDTLVPDSSHTLITSGYGTIGSSNYLGAAINSTGTLAVIYMPSNRTMIMDMSQFSGTVVARWYDPTDGSYKDDTASPLSNSGTHKFSRSSTNASGDHDWMLLLQASSTVDTIPPVISNINASTLDTCARITWDTDEPSTSQVFYGISPVLSDNTTESTDYVTAHEITLTGLVPDTTYSYSVKSRDASGNKATSPVFTFKTLTPEEVKRIYLQFVIK